MPRTTPCVACGERFAVSSGQLEWLQSRDLKTPTRCSTCRRGGSTSAERKRNEAVSQHEARIKLKRCFLGRLLGQGGATIEALRDKYQVSISIDTRNGEVVVRGATATAVEEAIDACKETVGEV